MPLVAVGRVTAAVVPARFAGHMLLVLLAVGVTATTVFLPARRVVNEALESFSIEEAATGESAFARGYADAEEPRFTPLSEELLAQLKPRPSVVTHVVQPGETITKLAELYKVTPQTIVWANNLNDADKLPIGHGLLILPVSGVLHTVRPGETIEVLADRYQIEPRAIAETNGLALEKQLGLSEQIVIPGARPLDPPRAQVTTRALDRTDAGAARPPAGAPARTEPAPSQPPAAVPAAPKPLTPTIYETADGDSLVSIARRFGVSTTTIMLANRLNDAEADALRIGQRLTVPPVDGVIHKVAEGETIRGVAGHYGVEAIAVITANAIPEPHVVLPGQELIVPGGKIPEPPPAPTAVPEPSVTYRVAAGDSVVSIGARFGVEPRTIARHNGLAQADNIAPGQVLEIPGGRERPPAAGSAAPRSAPAPAAPAPAPAPAAPAPVPVRQAQGPLAAAASLVRPIVRTAAPPAPPKPVVPPANNWGVIETASRFLGYAYTWGGHAPRTGFDCTGFTWYVFGQVGKWIPNHDLWGQMQSGPRVGRDNLQPGDLVFFANTYVAGLSHVGIYIGGGRFIHAGSERTGVTVTSLSDPYWAPRYYGASRPW